jgi:lysylphosphatidylglycerol synthetase-like protein (DUF2156 family)
MGTGLKRKQNTMNYENIMRRAAIPSVIAAAAVLLLLRTHAHAEALIGFASVAILAGVAALEYRLDWKWLVGR